MFATPDLIEQLTGYHYKCKQVEALRRMGIEHRVRADGFPLVSTAHLEKVFGGSSESSHPTQELDCFMSLEPRGRFDCTRMLQAYANLKIITGLRQQDMLCMKVTDFTEEGIIVDTQKTGKGIVIEWTDALRDAVSCALSVRLVDITPFVFCNRFGKSYYSHEKADHASGFKSMFKRYINRVIKETELEIPFTEHDLRAKTASDLEDLEHAQKLLAHTDAKMTKRYIRKRQKVRPAR